MLKTSKMTVLKNQMEQTIGWQTMCRMCLMALSGLMMITCISQRSHEWMFGSGEGSASNASDQM